MPCCRHAKAMQRGIVATGEILEQIFAGVGEDGPDSAGKVLVADLMVNRFLAPNVPVEIVQDISVVDRLVFS